MTVSDEEVMKCLDIVRASPLGGASIALPLWLRSRGYDVRRILDVVLERTRAARPLTLGDARVLLCLADSDASVGPDIVAALVGVEAEHVHPSAVVQFTRAPWAASAVEAWSCDTRHAANAEFARRLLRAVGQASRSSSARARGRKE